MKKGEMLNLAIQLAVNSHAGQYDRAGNPYILHPLKVMHYLKTDDEELQCVAILHDVCEDCGVTFFKLIEMGFSERVVRAVDCLTKFEGQSYEEYKQRVFTNRDSMLVKLEDLRHNSDIRRLKNKQVTDKDIARTINYQRFYLEIQEKLAECASC